MGRTWARVDVEGALAPGPRTGHSLTLVNSNIVMFGGLVMITRESNKTYNFNVATKRWAHVGST